MTDPLETEEAVALRDAVRSLLTRRSGPEAVRAAMESPLGYDDKLWSTLCEQIGVAALAIPECYGGAGAGLAEVCVVLAELGRTLTPAPMLGSAVLCGSALLGSGNEDACERLLPGIAAGTTLAALAWSDVDGSALACTASDTGLDGRAHYVLDGDIADVLLAVARTPDGVGLFEVPAGRCPPFAGHELGPDPAAGRRGVLRHAGASPRHHRLQRPAAARHRDDRRRGRAGRRGGSRARTDGGVHRNNAVSSAGRSAGSRR